jgi:membrane protein
MYERIVQYFERDLWEADLQALHGFHRFSIALLRLIVVAAWEFKESVLTIRATSLVYTTLLSLVPFLAVTFSVLKAFGIHQQIEPVLAEALEPLGTKGVELTTNIIEFVDNLKVGVLGAVGVAALFYTTYSLIEKIEEALNSIWHVNQGRSLARKFTDYLSVVLVGPVFVFTAFGLTASAQSHWLVQQVMDIQPFGYLMVVVSKLLPFFFICFVFTFIYKFVPYTQVDFKAALVGGITAGVLWQIAGMAFAGFVASSGRYSAIYSSFAVLILFLIWLYVGWLIVLAGAQVAYYYQNPTAYLMKLRWQKDTHVFREFMTLNILQRITHQYLMELPPMKEYDLSRALNVPLSVVEGIISELMESRVVVRTSDPEGVALGRPPEFVDVPEVLDIVSHKNDNYRRLGKPENRILNLLHRRDRAVRESLEGVTLRTLAEKPSQSWSEIEEKTGKSLGLTLPPAVPEKESPTP